MYFTFFFPRSNNCVFGHFFFYFFKIGEADKYTLSKGVSLPGNVRVFCVWKIKFCKEIFCILD